jgi:uncharacterized membrane protein YphA (DoxX/SURF4 family)
MNGKLRIVRVTSRIALGLIWLYEGFVPKLLFLRADEIDLVQRSGFIWRTPEITLQTLGLAQIVLGLWLLSGLAERAAVALATVSMSILLVLVARGNPGMLTDPYGALAKDFALIACAFTVWSLGGKKLQSCRLSL